jgi:hypothetical protein
MKRARIAAVATLVGISLAGPALLAQQAPEMRSVLAGRKVEQAFKGQAEVEFASSSTKSGDSVVTTMKVKMTSSRRQPPPLPPRPRPQLLSPPFPPMQPLSQVS